MIDGVKCRVRGYGLTDTIKNKRSREEVENNVKIPGPPMKIFPGETVRIRLPNRLPPYNSTAWNGNHNVPHELASTNLHLHGMDIVPHLFEPVGTSDIQAPMIAIDRGRPKNTPSRSSTISRQASTGITRIITARPWCRR